MKDLQIRLKTNVPKDVPPFKDIPDYYVHEESEESAR